MIIYTNIQRFDNLPNDQYRSMADGLDVRSFSNLKNERHGQVEKIDVTDKMKIGMLVDSIITSPLDVDINDPLYDIAKTIAYDLKKQFGDLFNVFEKQVSFFADIEYMGHRLKTSGRLDFLLPKLFVIDLKICSAKYVRNYADAVKHIENMGYNNQIWHYCKLACVSKGYIMMYMRSVKQTLIIHVPMPDRNEWIEQKILKLGTPIINLQ